MFTLSRKTKVGRVESVDFPDLGIHQIHAKIDTGAYGSAIDCKDIKVAEKEDKEVLKFTLLDPESDFFTGKKVIAKNFKTVRIKNSFGQIQRRYVIKTPIVLDGKKFSVELSLVDRGSMKYPVLLGRKALKNRFIVDVDHSFLVSKEERN
ncbi:MAG: RimK/LysX family protein [Candidatus Saccharimonadales bacterium]